MGGSLTRTGYGFRHYPYPDRSRVLPWGMATGTQKPHLEADVTSSSPSTGRSVLAHVQGTASGAYVHRFYGFGNETSAGG